MPLRKILLYGGCHALVLRDLLTAHFSDRLDATLLVNFELIRSGEPFPYENLKRFDLVIFSPIENKGTYNTVHLREACRASGVETACFPWLEWHGYCPGAIKGDFKNRFQWRYGALVEAASSFATFERFCDWAIESFPTDATIDACFARSTAQVRDAEVRHDMEIRIADFVQEHYRHSRLFLVSDHPSLKLYVHVLHQILVLLGIDGAATCARLLRDGGEPQWRWRTPIFPRVAERLDLRFCDTRWVDDEVVPGRNLDLRSYLRLYFYRDSVILGPLGAAAIAPLTTNRVDRPVGATTRLVADRIGERNGDTRTRYRLLDVLSADPMPLERNGHFEVEDSHWRTAWG